MEKPPATIIRSVLLLSLTVLSTATKASFLDVLGFGDKIDQAIQGGMAVIDHARDAGLALENEANLKAKERLEQIEAIADKEVEKISDIEKNASLDIDQKLIKITDIINNENKEIFKLEATIKQDLAELIDQAECSFDTAVNIDAASFLGKLGYTIGLGQIEITPPELYVGESQRSCIGAYFWECREHKWVRIMQPFTNTYNDVTAYLTHRLNDDATTETPTQSFVDTYTFLATFAKRTGCIMHTHEFNSDVIKYESMARRWRFLIKQD